MPKPWIRVSRASPCPICNEGNQWCCISADGKVAKCMKIHTKDAFKIKEDGSGLAAFYRLDKPIKVKPLPEVKPKTFKEVAELYAQYEGRNLKELSGILGVSMDSLEYYRAGYNGISWTNPMFDSNWRLIGIRLRHRNGKQTMIRGTHSGLFVGPRKDFDKRRLIFLPEGFSDPCALFDMGFYAMGRPSCSGGTEFLKQMLQGTDVVIPSDNDPPKKRPDGTEYFPGQEGAERLCDNLIPICRSVRIIKPPRHKDIRAWYNNGCTAQDIQYLMKNTKVFTKKRGLEIFLCFSSLHN